MDKDCYKIYHSVIQVSRAAFYCLSILCIITVGFIIINKHAIGQPGVFILISAISVLIIVSIYAIINLRFV